MYNLAQSHMESGCDTAHFKLGTMSNNQHLLTGVYKISYKTHI